MRAHFNYIKVQRVGVNVKLTGFRRNAKGRKYGYTNGGVVNSKDTTATTTAVTTLIADMVAKLGD